MKILRGVIIVTMMTLALILAALALRPYLHGKERKVSHPDVETRMPSVLYETDELGIGINKVSKNGLSLHNQTE